MPRPVWKLYNLNKIRCYYTVRSLNIWQNPMRITIQQHEPGALFLLSDSLSCYLLLSGMHISLLVTVKFHIAYSDREFLL
jgi:hypothetical protein